MNNAVANGRLAARPALATATGINLSFRFHHEQDYATYSGHGANGSAPVLLDWNQCFEFLSAIVRAARECVPDLDMMLVRSNGPHGDWKIPGELLKEDVLLCVDPRFQAEKLNRTGDFNRFLVIDHGLKRMPLEAGENQINLALYSKDENEATVALKQIREKLKSYETVWE